MKRHHEVPFGAEIVQGGVRFRLWAPKFEKVSLAIENGSELPMEAQEGGWFALTTGAARAGTRYRYRTGDLLVPDPASRYQPNDVHGPSEVVDPRSYEWRDDGWQGRPWEEIVLYELHTGTFSSSGDFAGVGRHLDHLVDLGVTAIELLPVNDFPGRRNWGYDGTLLFAPDAVYGRPEDLKRLVEACHARGLSIFLDVVYNHFGPDGNYLGHYANFFTTRHQTPWGDGINFDGRSSRAVRDFFIHNTLYWLEEFNVDGLRFDAVHAILDDSEPDIVTEIAEAARRHLPQRPVHLVLENDHNTARYLDRHDGHPVHHTAQWNDDVHHALRVAMTGTSTGYYMDYADAPAERLGRALAEGFTYQGEPSAYRDGARRGEASAQLPPTAFVSFIQNHDQVGNNAFGNRLSTLATAEAMHVGAAIMLLSPQIPMLFMGEEWGADQPFLYFVDMEPGLGAAIREGRRREFAKFAEFADEKARERIPDPNAETTWRQSILDWSALEKEPHRTWLARYRELIALRSREIAPRLRNASGNRGKYRVLGERALHVEWRLGDGATLRLVANFGSSAVRAEAAGRRLYATAEPGEPMSAVFFIA